MKQKFLLYFFSSKDYKRHNCSQSWDIFSPTTQSFFSAFRQLFWYPDYECTQTIYLVYIIECSKETTFKSISKDR